MDKSRKNINIKESLSKLLFILKILNKRSFLSLILLLLYMLIGALIELIYLICISQFTNHLINNDISLRQTTNDPIIVNNFYAKIILYISNFTSSDISANGIAIIIISIISLLVRLYVLRNSLNETARIGSLIESKCGEKLANVRYDFIKNLKISDVITNYNRIPSFINSIIQQGLLAISSLIIILFIVFYLNSQTYNFFLIAFFILASIYALILLLSNRKMKSISLNSKKFNLSRTSSLTYMVQMFRQITLEQKKNKVIKDYSQVSTSLYNLNSGSQFLVLSPKILIEYVAIISIAILFIIQTSINSSANSAASIGVFLIAILRILPSFQIIFIFLANLKKNSFVIEAVYEILQLPQEINNRNLENKPTINKFNKNIFSIKLQDISFKYPGTKNYLIENFSYEFRNGRSYALVGKSGSGKSTLIDLFLNLLSPSRGSIIINNRYELIKDYKESSSTRFLRSNSFLIGQNDYHIGSTIREILEISMDNLDDQDFLKRLKYASKKLELDELFKDQFLDKYIGENASKISGGQRQRLFLIKAFMSRKKIFIFDEVTSSLDQNSEKLVLDLIFDSDFLVKDKIFIFSTHSQVLAENCDEIINFNEIGFSKKRL